MGRTTWNFRNTKRANSANLSAKNYARVQRGQGWHIKLLSYLKVRGKIYGKS